MPIDVKKGQMLIRKIQYLLDGLELNAAEISDIEKDLMKGYIRSLYEMFLFEEKKSTPKRVKTKPKPVKAVPVTKKVQDIVPPVAEEPVLEKTVVVEKSVPPPSPEPKPEPIPESVAAPVVPPPPPPKAIREEHEKLFTFKKATDLSEKLQNRPVSDLNKAFAINDRLLTISKLFDGDDKLFKATLKDLNTLNSFEDAKVYLSHNVVDKLNWMSKDRLKTAKVFMKTVRRRYL